MSLQQRNAALEAKAPLKTEVQTMYPRAMAIYFGFDESQLAYSAQKEIFSALIEAKEQTDLSIVITAFADPNGDNNYNQTLKQQGSKAVKNFLISIGFKAEQNKLEMETDLSSADRDQDHLNRRVELRWE